MGALNGRCPAGLEKGLGSEEGHMPACKGLHAQRLSTFPATENLKQQPGQGSEPETLERGCLPVAIAGPGVPHNTPPPRNERLAVCPPPPVNCRRIHPGGGSPCAKEPLFPRRGEGHPWHPVLHQPEGGLPAGPLHKHRGGSAMAWVCRSLRGHK